MARACIDASLVVELLLHQKRAPQIEALWDKWREQGTELLGPPMLYAEVPSVLREKVHDRLLNHYEGERAFKAFFLMGILPVRRDDLHRRTWDLGRELNARRLYDVQYVALAQLERCELWTADLRLVNLVAGHCPWVRWIGEAEV